ncbi:MAG: YdeI/OmpD-associated family protein [Rhodothermales bacterium]
MTDDPTYRFTAPVLIYKGGSTQHFLPVPGDVAEEIRERGTRRLILDLNGHKERRALHNIREMGPAIILSKRLLKVLGVSYGDFVHVELRVDPDPDFVEVCEELRVALEQDTEAAERFYAMTPGRQRSLAYYANSAKRVETRIKRSLELAGKLRTHMLAGDQKKEL